MAFIISVPPPPVARGQKRLRLAHGSPGSAGTGLGKQDVRVAGEVIRLNVSRGCRPSSASCIASLAFSMGKPDMEPEVSSTKTSSLGAMSRLGTRVGRLQDQREEAAALDAVMASARRPRLRCPATSYLQDEILVGDRRPCRAGARRPGAALGRIDVDIVGLRMQALDRHAGIERDLDRDIVPGARALGRRPAA